MFSKACEYAIRATILIAMEGRKGRRMSLVEIADRTGSPKAFTAKVLQQLARASSKAPRDRTEVSTCPPPRRRR